MRRVFCALVAMILAACRLAGAAEIVPAGPEFRISRGANANYQFDGYAAFPRIASTPAGKYIVVWKSTFESANTFGEVVMGRRLDALARSEGTEFEMSLRYHDSEDVTLPDVATDPAGGFIVVWNHFDDFDRDPGPAYRLLRFRRFDSSGSALGPEVPFTDDADNFAGQSVVGQPDGGFTIVWSTYGPGIDGQRFDANGAPVGPRFDVSTGGSYPTASADASGNFVVSWDDDCAYFRRFDSLGTALGAAQGITGFDPYGCYDGSTHPALDVDRDGNFVVVEDTNSHESYALWGHRWDASGAAVGPEFMVGDEDDFHAYPAVAYDRDGSFLVTWLRWGARDIRVRHYDAGGVQDAPETTVTDIDPTGGESFHLIDAATDPAGDFVVVWMDYDRFGIWGRRFTMCGNGRIGAGTECDDGNVAAGDGCSPTCAVETCHTCSDEPSACTQIAGCTAVCSDAAPIDDTAVLVVAHAGAPLGDENVSLKATVRNPPLAPGQYDPSTEGLEVAVTGGTLVYQAAGATAVPAGLRGTGCGPLDGWKVNRSRTVFTYKNVSNALPPACTPGSANGLRTAKVKDRLAVDGSMRVEMKAVHATVAGTPAVPVTGTVIMGTGAGASGRCGRTTFVTARGTRFFPALAAH